MSTSRCYCHLLLLLYCVGHCGPSRKEAVHTSRAIESEAVNRHSLVDRVDTRQREREGEHKRARKTQTFHNSESPPTEMRIDWTLCRPTAALSIFNGSSILLLNFVSFLRHFDGNPVTPQRSRHFRNGRKASPHFPSAPKSKKRRQNGRVSPPKTKRLLRSSSRSKGNYSNQGMTSLNASAVYISYLSQNRWLYTRETTLGEKKKQRRTRAGVHFVLPLFTFAYRRPHICPFPSVRGQGIQHKKKYHNKRAR